MAAAVPLKQDTGELSEFLTGDFLPVANGGTGAITAGAACTALGALGSASNLSDVASIATTRTNLLLTGRTTSGDVDLTLAPTTTTVARVYQNNANLTATRTWTLPASNALAQGETLWLQMGNGSSVSNSLGSFGINITAAGTDKINGGSAGGSFLVRQSNCIVMATTNGSNGWVVAVIQPAATGFTSGGTNGTTTFAPTSPVSSYLFTTAITAGRTFNLTAGYPAGWTVTVTRTAASTGAFNLTVQDATTTANQKLLAVSQWVEFVSDGTSWNEAAFGSL